MKKIVVVLGILGAAAVAYAGKDTGVIKPSKVAWQPMMGDAKAGPWLHVVQGDPDKGPHTLLLKFKGGFESPWHTHDASYSAVVLQGTQTHQDKGGELLKASTGESYTSEGGVLHQNKCLGKTDCVIFAASSGPRSFNMPKAE